MRVKRIISLVLSAVTVVSMMASIAVPVAAASYENTYINTGDLRKDIIGVAKTQLGYKEGAGNDTKYGDWYGYPNQAWCAMFVSWCAAQANVPETVLKKCARASPEKPHFDLAYYESSVYMPMAGDLFFTKGFTHVGFVYSVEGEYFHTIEGNSNSGGSRDGDGVVSNKRLLKDYYFAIPGYNNQSYYTLCYQLNGASIPNVNATYNQYKVVTASGVNMRSKAGTSNSVLLTVPKNASIIVTETASANGYVWGKTTYGSKTGWCVISENWTQKIGTVPVVPYKKNASGLLCDNRTGALIATKLNVGSTDKVPLLSNEEIGMVKSGYIFAGWRTAFNSGIFIADGASLPVSALTANKSVQNTVINLQAVWVPAKFHLAYDANGGSIRSNSFEINDNLVYNINPRTVYYQDWMQSETKANGLVNGSSFGVYKRGYTLKGWGTSRTGGKIYDQNQAIKAALLYGEVFGNTTKATVYAIWEPNVLNVQYHPNGGSINSTTFKIGANGIYYRSTNAIAQQKWVYNQKQPNGLANWNTFGLTRTGYTFIGWSTQVSGGKIFNMDDLNLLPTDIYSGIQSGGGTLTLYARWVPNSHQHQFKNYLYNHDATALKNGTETGSCSCGATHIRAKAGTKLCNSAALYQDVSANAWYKQSMDYAITHGILAGGSNGKLMPDKKITRAEFVQILASLSGVNTTNKAVNAGFSDVKSGVWYAPAVKWAKEKGIVAGTGGGKFSPDGYLTREQMCTILVRYAFVVRKVKFHQTDDCDFFTDSETISTWARTPVDILRRARLISGINDNEFGPRIHATRAAVATIIMEFHKDYIA